jgi:cytochrome c oxidase subunit II
VRMFADGAGGGQGPNPIAKPDPPANAKPLQVQVIGQQWEWTYRFPDYGGVETAHLELPANRTVEFHVTSLDVIHSFWAYQLGVKADANPGIDNIAYAQTKGPMNIDIHCAELCGLWHGYMSDSGRVVSPAAFSTWIAARRAQFAPIMKYLPKYAPSYAPDPTFRAG